MKVAKALLIFPCLCLLNACQGSKDTGTETSLSVASSPQFRQNDLFIFKF